MATHLLVSGLSSTSFFTLTREVVENEPGDYRVVVVPYFPALGATWIEYLTSLEINNVDTVYILGSLNCMLDKYYLLYLAEYYDNIVLVPGKACIRKIEKIQTFHNNRVHVINTPGNYKDYLERKTQFKLWMTISYLYVENPSELEKISNDILTLELDLDSIVERILRKYYYRANDNLESLKHRLLYEEEYYGIEIRNAKYLIGKYLPLLPVLTRILSLETSRFIITKYAQKNKPYAYIVLSLPRNNGTTRIGANMVKTLLLSKKQTRRTIKASIAGANMLEIMTEKEHLDNVINELVKILELVDSITTQRVSGQVVIPY